MPSLAIAASRSLKRDLEAFFNNFALDRLLEVETLTHAAGGCKDFFGGKVQLHGV